MSCVPVMMLLKNKTQNKPKEDRCKGIIKIKTELGKRENKNNLKKYAKETDRSCQLLITELNVTLDKILESLLREVYEHRKNNNQPMLLEISIVSLRMSNDRLMLFFFLTVIKQIGFFLMKYI